MRLPWFVSYPGKYPTGCHLLRSKLASEIHRQDVCAADSEFCGQLTDQNIPGKLLLIFQ
ncbi:hypothetical protein [Microcoleus sp. CAWBG58]|uniref:hypothetical protein n=1 Tax=Microcoleus sp. CAWBG58 TaxID=2841651 RepID=UPI0025DD710E|nr:hypothetical protein [Microcoleus sp. CAWBG58]